MNDVKLVRIPRPKFASAGGPSTGAGAGGARRNARRCPAEPPTDYSLDSVVGTSDLDRATEELRRAVQEKL